MGFETETLIIGAGLAGLTVASGLARAGADVRVIEKSRGLGGRLATRRAGELHFDHGAQYLRPRTPGFAAMLDGLGAAAATWSAVGSGPGQEAARVGLPGMSALARPLAAGLRIETGIEAAQARRRGGTWSVTDGTGDEIARAGRLVLAIPAPQAARVLDGHPLGEHLDAVVFAPCWTLMAAFVEPPDLPETRRAAEGALGWIARDSGKPGRPVGTETWVAQASAEWSRAHLELDKAAAAEALMAELAVMAGGGLPEAVHVSAHRWRFSQAEVPLGAPCLSAPDEGLVLAGDWCLGSRAEHAWQSGNAALAALGTVAAL